jgi:acyl-CoA synthetase (NDP forming)
MSSLTEIPPVPERQTAPTRQPEEHASSFRSLRPFFQPRALAVVGASECSGSIGARLFQTLQQGGYQGKLYPVNPRERTVGNLPAYRSVRDLPTAVDLAIIVTPPEEVLGVVDDCAARSVPALLVITAGFAETGPEGAALQRQLQQKVRAAGMRLLGPNSVGLIATAPAVSLNATFVPVFPHPGRIAISADSGAFELVLVNALTQRDLGVSCFAAVGNRADVSCTDLLEYLEHEDATSLIVLYLESLGDARRFVEVGRRVNRRKPIVALKAGRTRAGIRAAGSHTAAQAAREVAVDAVFHQTGIQRVSTLQELLDLTAALSVQPLPRGRRVAVLTNAAGPAVLCADVCEAAGLILPELSAHTREELATFLPVSASLANPVDMIASATAEDYRRAIAALLRSGEVDALIVVWTCADQAVGPAVQEAIASAVREGRAQVDHVPVLACLLAGRSAPPWLLDGSERIPCFSFPEEPGRVLARMADYAEWRRQEPPAFPIFDDMDLATARAICRARRSEGDWLPTQAARDLLQAVGLPLVPGEVVASADEAVEVARILGFPVAAKLASHEVLHKSEPGCVHLNLPDEAAVRAAFEAICDQLSKEWSLDAMEGVLVQPMIRNATEVLVGAKADRASGRLITFGLGGIHVEVLGDVCLRIAPLTAADAREMVRSIRGLPLLLGYRGQPPADVVVLEEVLLRVSCLVEAVPEVVELQLNPVFALSPGQGCLIADARVRVGPE